MGPELAVILGSTAIRLLAVLAGTMAIYVGYRLFALVPEHKGGESRLTLPGGASFFASKVAPGVFFAIFGTGLIGYSVTQPMTYSRTGTNPVSGERMEVGVSGMNPAEPTAERLGGTSLGSDRREEIIGTLNAWLAELPDDIETGTKLDRETAVKDVKLALMRESWDEATWGDYAAFDRWITQRAQSGPVPEGSEEAAALFNKQGP